jgi:hypothetical protein
MNLKYNTQKYAKYSSNFFLKFYNFGPFNFTIFIPFYFYFFLLSPPVESGSGVSSGSAPSRS